MSTAQIKGKETNIKIEAANINDSSTVTNASKKPKKDKKLIRFNKTKIIIISIITFVIIFGISVGIYFAVKENKLLPNKNQIKWVDNASDARKEVLKYQDDDQIVGVFFGQKGLENSDLVLYDEVYTSDSSLSGIFSKYLEDNEATHETEWIGVMFDEDEDLSNELKSFFISDLNEDNPINSILQWDLFFYAGSAKDSWAGEENGNEFYDRVEISVKPGVVDGSEESKYDLVELDFDSTTTNENGAPIWSTFTLPMWIWFYKGELIYVTCDVPVITDEDGGPSELDDSAVSENYFELVEEKINDNLENGSPTPPSPPIK